MANHSHSGKFGSILYRPVIGCVIVLIIWSLFAAGDNILVPSPIEIVQTLIQLCFQGPLLLDASVSIGRVLTGVLIVSLIVAVLLGISAILPRVADYLLGPIEIVRPVPPIAWVPVAILALGIGNEAAISIVALGAFFPFWLTAIGGLRQVRKAHLMTARSLGASHRIVLANIIIPSVAPSFIQGLRLAIGLGWFSVVAAEMLGVSSGLGHGIQLFSLNLELTELYAYILVVGIIGFILNTAILYLERSIGHWQSAESYIDE